MSKPEDIPQDIFAIARTLGDQVSFGGYEVNTLMIARALVGEREAAAVAGWNACRKSIYAVCEDVQDEYEKHRQDTDSVNRHHFGRGGMTAAKSIARGFGSLEALDDDNLTAAIRNRGEA